MGRHQIGERFILPLSPQLELLRPKSSIYRRLPGCPRYGFLCAAMRPGILVRRFCVHARPGQMLASAKWHSMHALYGWRSCKLRLVRILEVILLGLARGAAMDALGTVEYCRGDYSGSRYCNPGT